MPLLLLTSRALLLGLSTGLYCLGFCIPLVAPVLLSYRSHLRESAATLALFLLGRLSAYLLFGLVFGALGGFLVRFWSFRTIWVPILHALLGFLMILYGLAHSFPRLELCRVLRPRFQSRWYPALLGLLAGINLCPPFLLAVTAVLDVGGIIQGMVFFLAFFLATSVYLLPLLFSGLAARFDSVRFAARFASVLVGIYFIFLSVRVLLFLR